MNKKVIDLIGIPFPKNEPSFISDELLQRELKLAEEYVEIYNEFKWVESTVEILCRLSREEEVKIIQSLSVFSHEIADPILIGAIITYCKSFTNSSRKKLNPNKIFTTNETCKKFHHDIFKFRNKWLAHQEFIGDQHQMFVIQKTDTSELELNPFGSSPRTVISSGFNLEIFKKCIENCMQYVKKKIQNHCQSIENHLSQDQINFINGLDKKEARKKYWNQNRHNRIDPFENRKN